MYYTYISPIQNLNGEYIYELKAIKINVYDLQNKS